MHDYRQLAMDFMIKVWNKDGVKELNNFITDDFLYESPLTNARGIDWYKDFIESSKIAFSNIDFQIKQAYSRDNTASLFYKFESDHTGIFVGIEPSYKRIGFEAFAYFEFEEDKVRYIRVIFDSLELKNKMLKN